MIGQDMWQAMADPRSAAADPVAFAVEVAPYRRMASVAVAGARGDGRVHAEVVDYRPDAAWVPARVAELARKWRPCAVVLDPGSHAGSLIEDLAQVGVEVVKPFGATDAAHAATGFYDAAVAGDLAHRDQGMLNAALAGAKTWGPGLITVSWVLCDRPPAQAVRERTGGGPAGHMAVFCNAARGCRSVWYLAAACACRRGWA